MTDLENQLLKDSIQFINNETDYDPGNVIQLWENIFIKPIAIKTIQQHIEKCLKQNTTGTS